MDRCFPVEWVTCRTYRKSAPLRPGEVVRSSNRAHGPRLSGCQPRNEAASDGNHLAPLREDLTGPRSPMGRAMIAGNANPGAATGCPEGRICHRLTRSALPTTLRAPTNQSDWLRHRVGELHLVASSGTCPALPPPVKSAPPAPAPSGH